MTQDVKKILKISVFSLFFILIFGYAFFRSYDLLLGVKIKNLNIVDGAPARTTVQSGGKMTDNVLKVTGNAKNATKLTLNGREISIEQDGNWEETIALLSGYNLINIKAEDKFGNKDEKNYQLIY